MLDVTTKLDKHHVLIVATYSNESGTGQWNFSVDETMSNLNIMIAGDKSKVWIYDPNNKTLKNDIKTFALNNVKAYTIESPETGEWKLDTFSRGPYSVRLTAKSKISLSHGFSIEPPNTMADVRHFTPLGGKHSLLVSIQKCILSVKEYQIRFILNNSIGN